MEYDFYVCLTALSRIFATRCAAGRRLVEMFDDISTIFSLSRDDLDGIFGASSPVTDRILDRSVIDWAQREVDWALENGVEMLCMGRGNYPSRLMQCADAPLMLYYKGAARPEALRVLSVVGTRRATYYGREYCRRIIESMARDGTEPLIVSGLALGIDGCAHAAAMDAGLDTVAVLPCSLDTVYPQRHRELACRILEHGGLLTDFPRGTPVMSHTFVRRNRIIAGLADAVLVAESYRRGGSLITASLAGSYDREVFAVPGRNTDESFAGCNWLISRNAAVLVSGPDSISLHMGWKEAAPVRKDPELFPIPGGGAGEKVVASLKIKSPQSAEELLPRCGLAAGELPALLLEMELSGVISALPGGKYELNR